MTRLLVAIVTAVMVACLGIPILLYAALTGAGPGSCTTTAVSDDASTHAWTAEQADIAATIVEVGIAKAVPPWGWVVALATAMQESGMRNLPYLGEANDHDSIGVFQQRPSQGWGTVEQLADPAYQAGKFYDKLLTVPGWEQLPLTAAAQAVQRSAYPDAYAKWADDATAMLATLGSTIPEASPGILSQCVSMTGWVQPVHASVVSGFRTEERPGHNGVDLGAARGTTIAAASAGTVVVVACNISPASWGCDQDGNTSTPGCGWYVDIRHAGNVYTRYCHMLARPNVEVGQQVMAGQPIGIVGSSGNSSGPHLHFETHLGDQSSVTAIDPASFMIEMGAPLIAG